MPLPEVIYYLEDDGTVPIVEWLASVPRRHTWRGSNRRGMICEGRSRDYLRDGIHELRPSLGGVHYRILYFFQGNKAIVVSHGLTKKQEVPMTEIERAVKRMERFKSDSRRHTFTQ